MGKTSAAGALLRPTAFADVATLAVAAAGSQSAVFQDIAVQLNGFGVARALVQVVNVLGEQRQHAGVALHKVSQRHKASVGLGNPHTGTALGVSVPDPL